MCVLKKARQWHCVSIAVCACMRACTCVCVGLVLMLHVGAMCGLGVSVLVVCVCVGDLRVCERGEERVMRRAEKTAEKVNLVTAPGS